MDSLSVFQCYLTSTTNYSSQNHHLLTRQSKFVNQVQIRPKTLPGFHSRNLLSQNRTTGVSRIVCSVSSVETREEEKEKESMNSTVRLSIRINHQVKFGEHIAVLGSAKEFGSWKKKKTLNWTENGWVCEMELKGGESVEFKFIIVKDDKHMVWEHGDNRILKLPTHGSFELVCHWNKVNEAANLLPFESERKIVEEKSVVANNDTKNLVYLLDPGSLVF